MSTINTQPRPSLSQEVVQEPSRQFTQGATDRLSDGSPIVAATSIKSPPLTEKCPSAWFTVLEAQFYINSISRASTKFYHAIAGLPPNVIISVPENILKGASYDELKASVISHFEATKPELFDQFLKDTPMVGRPSHYLLEMRRMAAKLGVQEDLVRHRFQSAVPTAMAPILATQKDASLDDLGKLADELQSLCSTTSTQIYSICKDKPSSSSHPNKDINITPFSSGQRSKVCRAHVFFGNKARSCKSWCQWPNKSNCKIIHSNHPSRSNSPMAKGNGNSLQ
jgi:hypothetical protein